MFIEDAIATLGIPGSIAVVILSVFGILQLIGELLEIFGKTAPTFFKLRKLITRRRRLVREQHALLQNVEALLQSFNEHYDEDNIAKRNNWIRWVNDRATVYDTATSELKASVDQLTAALQENTKMTTDMFVEQSRDRIIDFASKVADPHCCVSREEFHRIFKVHRKYELFLQEHNMTNGEVSLNYQIIEEAYRDRTEHHTFLEDTRGMNS